MPGPTIFAMGGGGFLTEPADAALERYVLQLAEPAEPQICFLPTASGEPQGSIVRFHAAFDPLPCRPSALDLFRLDGLDLDLHEHLLGQDIVYVGGGSMRNMLAIWHEHGLDRILPEAWERGVVLCGLSAGSMCWFRHGITKSGGPLELVPGLGLLPASNSVHWTAEPDRRVAYLDAVAAGLEPGWGVDDGAGLRFAGTELVEAVSARPEAGAYRVQRRNGGAAAHAIPVRHLDAPDSGIKVPPPEVAELRELRELRAARRGGRLRA
ncbi:MAG TPA: peptidase E [Candidatus Limnocylindria bacterium]|jgi:peptidase E|nr:peptidase E [Candidatus Limnocylindria bacterium]